MKSKPFTIAQTSVVEDFSSHLKEEDNYRILFSAPFGAGKSTFLESFFEDCAKDYTTLKLYPVNYSVAGNIDVFEYIKLDILTELMRRYGTFIEVNQDEYSYFETIPTYFNHVATIYPFITSILKVVAALKGEIATKVVDSIQDNTNTIIDNNAAVNDNEGEKLSNYIDWWKTQKGSIYERDEITYLLSEILKRLKKD